VNGDDGVDRVTTNGTAGDDTIAVANNGPTAAVFDPAGQVYELTAESLVLNGLGGNDTLVGQNGISFLTRLTVNGGAGNDTLRGGDGPDLLTRASTWPMPTVGLAVALGEEVAGEVDADPAVRQRRGRLAGRRRRRAPHFL
jgi:Ca2+-binding RTX toxin-like protein